eukprot:10710580-Alexandrium_andersonii.AAC.1
MQGVRYYFTRGPETVWRGGGAKKAVQKTSLGELIAEQRSLPESGCWMRRGLRCFQGGPRVNMTS